jgi:hypothetical protein
VWLERAQRWLAAYEEKRKRTWRAERAVVEETRAWERWVWQGKHALHRTKSAEERGLLLAQLQAAGERFLAGHTHWEDGKPAGATMDTVRKKTNALIALLNAEQKKRGEAV